MTKTPATPLTDDAEGAAKDVITYCRDGWTLARHLEKDRARLVEALHNLFCATCDPDSVLTDMQKRRQTEASALLRELGEL